MQKYYQYGIERMFLRYRYATQVSGIFLCLAMSYYFRRNYISFIFYVIAQLCSWPTEFILRILLSLLQNKPVPPGPPAPELLKSNLISLVPPVLYDTPRWGRNFGDVIQQPTKVASPGDTVTAIFVGISLGLYYTSEKALWGFSSREIVIRFRIIE